jgi:hypothetical protein
MLALLRRALVWVAFEVQLGRLNPYILGLAIGRWPRKLTPEDELQWRIDFLE